jgi:hypothetical protein
MDENGFYNSPSPENFYPGGLIVCSGPRIRIIIDGNTGNFWPGTKELKRGQIAHRQVVNTSTKGLLIERASIDIEQGLYGAHFQDKEPFRIWKVLMDFDGAERQKLWWFIFSNTLFENYELIS